MLEREEICLEKVKVESTMKRRFLAERVGGMGCVEEMKSDGLMLLQVYYESPIRKKFSFGRIKGEVR